MSLSVIDGFMGFPLHCYLTPFLDEIPLKENFPCVFLDVNWLQFQTFPKMYYFEVSNRNYGIFVFLFLLKCSKFSN